MQTTMYDILLQLPLFQGICKSDLTTIIEKVKFHFIRLKKGDIIAMQDSLCNKLYFLLNGEVTLHRTDKEYGYTLSETITAPEVFEPQSMFGIQTTYKATYRAEEDAKVLVISKDFISQFLIGHEIFRLNYLNILSSYCQTYDQKLWKGHMRSIEEKFVRFFLLRCRKPHGAKSLEITMEDLGNLIDETRINVSRLLNDLQTKNIITLKRKEIYVHDLDKLAKHLL